MQRFLKPSKPCHVGIHWVALAEHTAGKVLSAFNTGNNHKTIRPLQFDYLCYELRKQEMSHFGIKEKLKNVFFLFYLIFF